MNEKLRQTFLEFWDHLIEMAPNILVAIIVMLIFF